MKALDTIIVKNLTRLQVDAIRLKAEARGIDIKRDNGDFRFSQTIVHYDYDEKQGVVKLDISAPYDVTREDVVKVLKEEFIADGLLPSYDGTKMKDEPVEKPVEIVEEEDKVKEFVDEHDPKPQPSGSAVMPLPEAEDN